MENVVLGIHHLPIEHLQDPLILHELIYPNMYKNYYWSDDFTPEYYIAQAKAGFIAVTDQYEEQELLLPEIQYTYAVLDFEDLHISKKVKNLLTKKNLHLEVTQELDEVVSLINASHKNCWLSPAYLKILNETKGLDANFNLISIGIREDNVLVSGEIGYVIGKTYTSLSGFSSRKKCYSNYGTAQLVLLAQYLQASGFAFWNLGQPYMSYKLALGAKIYDRKEFLVRWFAHTN